MSVKLEKYLIGERKNLDVESPDDKAIWGSIKGRLHDEGQQIKRLNNRIRFLMVRNAAATAIILFSLGYIANDIVSRKLSSRQVTLSSINTDLGKRENEYRSLVNYKTEEVRAVSGSEDKVIIQLFEEIRNLDLVYNQAMTDLKELGPNERVINTIFSTYEQKIRLLELIILETNKQSHENKKIIL
jgi:hypothetical protein